MKKKQKKQTNRHLLLLLRRRWWWLQQKKGKDEKKQKKKQTPVAARGKDTRTKEKKNVEPRRRWTEMTVERSATAKWPSRPETSPRRAITFQQQRQQHQQRQRRQHVDEGGEKGKRAPEEDASKDTHRRLTEGRSDGVFLFFSSFFGLLIPSNNVGRDCRASVVCRRRPNNDRVASPIPPPPLVDDNITAKHRRRRDDCARRSADEKTANKQTRNRHPAAILTSPCPRRPHHRPNEMRLVDLMIAARNATATRAETTATATTPNNGGPPPYKGRRRESHGPPNRRDQSVMTPNRRKRPIDVRDQPTDAANRRPLPPTNGRAKLPFPVLRPFLVFAGRRRRRRRRRRTTGRIHRSFGLHLLGVLRPRSSDLRRSLDCTGSCCCCGCCCCCGRSLR